MDFNIPLEIKDKSAFPQLKKNDRLTIAYAVLFGVGNQEAFMRFNPHYIDASGKQLNPAGKKASSQFWNYGKVKDYREQYEKELAEFLGRSNKTYCSDTTDAEELTEEEKKNLKGKFANKVYRALGTAEGLEELKTAADLGKAAKIIKEEETQVEPARRYLPARCYSECAYRLFVESHIESGDIISECDYCRTRKFAEEHGWRFDPTKNLDLPIKNNDNAI